MSYTVRTIYTKPNVDVSLHTPPTEYTNQINSFFDAGKIIQKPTESIDGLTHIYTMIFDNETSFNEFKSTSASISNYTMRNNHCDSNSISYSIEQDI